MATKIYSNTSDCMQYGPLNLKLAAINIAYNIVHPIPLQYLFNYQCLKFDVKWMNSATVSDKC